MESAVNRVGQCIKLGGRYLTGFVLDSSFLVMFLRNGRHLFQFTLLWINVNKLSSISVFDTARWTLPHSAVCTRRPILRPSCSNRLQGPRETVNKASSLGLWTNIRFCSLRTANHYTEEFGGSKRDTLFWNCGENQIILKETVQGKPSWLRSKPWGWAKCWDGAGT